MSDAQIQKPDLLKGKKSKKPTKSLTKFLGFSFYDNVVKIQRKLEFKKKMVPISL